MKCKSVSKKSPRYTLADIPYQFVDVSGFDHEGTSRDLLKTLNPLCQVPTLAL
ncbi:glutathione S-transferase [Escherichia coli]|nr:glutathione S-transferase [Escherichia coli]